MLMGHAEGVPKLGSSSKVLLSDPESESDGDEETGTPEKIIYMASFDELGAKSVQYDTIIWFSISLLLVLAWGIGIIMLLYLPIRRYVLKKEISQCKLYITPDEIVYKVSRPSFIPFWGDVKFEKHVPLPLVIDIIIEQGCLQSMFGLHTFRVESIARGKAAPVDELQVQGVHNPGLLRKVIVTEASKVIHAGRSWRPVVQGGDGESIARMEALTWTPAVLSSPSKASRLTGSPMEHKSFVPSDFLLHKLEEVNKSVKDTGFPMTERDRLGLRGLLPPRVITFEQQYDRFMESFRSLEKNTGGQPDSVISLAKWRILNRLHDRNETLYYRVLIDNIKDFAPIIYTPTVGLVCQNYSGLFRRPRGMYFSAKDKGEMMSMIFNWPSTQVDMIVLTDGSRILGLGDLGVQGIGIPVGKLDMYVAAAGINPQRVLPVMLDVGTNNQKLLEDPLYLGLRQPRLEGEEYLSIVDEFVEAVHARWPKAVVQFEDFQAKWAFETLDRYRKKFCMFNDDIQGTAGVALAGLLGTVRAQGRPLTDFANQKIVVVGAGSAGLGVLKMALQAVSRMGGPSADPHFFLLDKNGLITKDRKDIDPAALPFAKAHREIEELGLQEGAGLAEVVKKVKPHVLLGLSGVGGIFHEEVLRAMRESDSVRPAIFAMSNPTNNAECCPVDAFKLAGEDIVFASGSPFENVDLGNGKMGHVNQANNMYLFPGIGLGALLSGARNISDTMLEAAAECLASYMSDDEIKRGILYPSINDIRDITAEVGAAVLRAAVAEDLAEGHGDVGARELQHMSEEETIEHVRHNMWYPVYGPLVHEK